MGERAIGIFGAGGHGFVLADTALLMGEWDSVFFYDDSNAKVETFNGPWKIHGGLQCFLRTLPSLNAVAIALGDNRKRLDMLRELDKLSVPFATVIHPRATISKHATVGTATVIYAGAVVNAGARIGKGVIINTGAIVDHDCRIADGVHISPGASIAGNVSVGEETWVGVGSTVRDGVRIGRGVMVGAGAVVVCDVPDNVVVMGIPAKVRG